MLSPGSEASPSEAGSREVQEDVREGSQETDSAPSAHPQPTPAEDATEAIEKPATTAQRRPSSSPAPSRRQPSPSASTTPLRSTRAPAPTNREVEDLRTKLSLLERRRLEDREKLKQLDRLQTERDRFEAIVNKLQAKLQPQSSELVQLRKQIAESALRFANIENMQAEHDAELENATLDREMAEETSEMLKAEVEALRERCEELGLEVEVLREENEELGREMSPEERGSQGWVQLERSNERLREALLRLRDMTQENETELKGRVKELEGEVKELGDVRAANEEVEEKLRESNAAVEDLKQQLEIAQGAEDLIEDLGEQKERLQEEVEELKATIDDLESLRELNDELEINHVEAEKQYLEEIDFKDSVINEQVRRAQQQQQTIEDLEYTIARFRQLVTDLQANLEEMRASRQISDTETEELSSRSRAMMDLNMKLQVNASKTQVKTIDLELRRLEAEEAAEHLAIVQLFLPDAFNADRDSVLALLRFKRVGFKARLVRDFVKDRISGQGTRPAEEDLFAACGVVDKLTWIQAMSERFVSSICGCSVEEFRKYESALYELEPVERALNSYIDGLKRDELREKRVDDELQRTMAVMEHLASLHIQQGLATTADDILMKTQLVESHLDSSGSALAASKALIRSKMPQPAPEEEEGPTELDNFFTDIDTLISQIRGAKFTASKTHRQVSDLHARSLTLDPVHLASFSASETTAATLTRFSTAFGTALQALFSSEGRTEPYTVSELLTALTTATTTVLSAPSAASTPFAAATTRLRTLTDAYTPISTLASDLTSTHEFLRNPNPWVSRATSLKNEKIRDAEQEAELLRLHDLVRDRSLLVRAKEAELEEHVLRIEMLEARQREVSRLAAANSDLEAQARDAKKALAVLEAKYEDLKVQIARVRTERDGLRIRAEKGEQRRKGEGMVGGVSRVELERERERVRSREALVRWLQGRIAGPLDASIPVSAPLGRRPDVSAGPSRGVGADADLSWLTAPLIPPPPPAEQRRQLLHAEGRDVLQSLLHMATAAKPVDLTRLPEKKLAWRPAAETSAYVVGKRREEWERWEEWRRSVVARAGEAVGSGMMRGRFRGLGKGEGLDGAGRGGVVEKGRVDGGASVRIVEPGEEMVG